MRTIILIEGARRLRVVDLDLMRDFYAEHHLELTGEAVKFSGIMGRVLPLNWTT